MGLFDAVFANPEATNALAAGLLSGNFGAGLLGMNQVRAQQAERVMRQQAHELQMESQRMEVDKHRRAMQREQGLESMQTQFYQPATQARGDTGAINAALGEYGIGGQPALPAKPASFDLQGFSTAAVNKGLMTPMQMLQLQQAGAKESSINKLDAEKFTPQSLQKFAKSRNYGDLVPRNKLEFVEGVGVDPYDPRNAGRAVPNPNKPFSLSPQGGIVPNTQFQQYELGKAAAGAARTQNNLINAGPKAFEVELAKLDANQLDAWRKSAETAQSTLGTVQALRQADTKDAYSGGGSDAKLAASSLINGLTGITPKGLVGSEMYNSEAKKLILDRVKALGANPSNADREFIEKTVPQLSTSKEARARMADYMERKAQEQIGLYQRAESHARKNHSLGGFQQLSQPQQSGGGVVDFGSLK